jgi:hypothetical protein
MGARLSRDRVNAPFWIESMEAKGIVRNGFRVAADFIGTGWAEAEVGELSDFYRQEYDDALLLTYCLFSEKKLDFK